LIIDPKEEEDVTGTSFGEFSEVVLKRKSLPNEYNKEIPKNPGPGKTI